MSSGSTPPPVGIPLDLLALALDTSNEFSRRALFRPLTEHPWLGCSRPTVEPGRWASLRSLEVPAAVGAKLTLRQKEGPQRFVFLPIGRAFLGGNHCGAVPFAESVTSCHRKIRPLGGGFIEDVTVIVGSGHYGMLINIGAPPGCCPLRILPSPLLLLSLHLPAHLRHDTSLRGETCRVAFHRPGRCWWGLLPPTSGAHQPWQSAGCKTWRRRSSFTPCFLDMARVGRAAGQNKANHTLLSITAIQATWSKAFYLTIHKQGDTHWFTCYLLLEQTWEKHSYTQHNNHDDACFVQFVLTKFLA